MSRQTRPGGSTPLNRGARRSGLDELRRQSRTWPTATAGHVANVFVWARDSVSSSTGSPSFRPDGKVIVAGIALWLWLSRTPATAHLRRSPGWMPNGQTLDTSFRHRRRLDHPIPRIGRRDRGRVDRRSRPTARSSWGASQRRGGTSHSGSIANGSVDTSFGKQRVATLPENLAGLTSTSVHPVNVRAPARRFKVIAVQSVGLLERRGPGEHPASTSSSSTPMARSTRLVRQVRAWSRPRPSRPSSTTCSTSGLGPGRRCLNREIDCTGTIQPVDGKIASGSIYGQINSGASILQVNADGSPDASFGTGRTTPRSFRPRSAGLNGFNEFITSIAIQQPDGKIDRRPAT